MMKKTYIQRFSDRVENYVKYRPGYPLTAIDYLEKHANLQHRSTIADVGAGTGIFTSLLLDAGYKVFAVEPNQPMRKAAEELLGSNVNFISTDGTADATRLTTNSVDLIVCAQAFHWFNTPETVIEFQRILKPGGYVALIWNKRESVDDHMAIEY